MSLPRITSAELRPFSSAVILEAPELDGDAAFKVLGIKLKALVDKRRGGNAIVVASGIDQPTASADDSNDGVSNLDGFIFRKTKPPRWAKGENTFIDTDHDLVLYLRHGSLFAVGCEGALRDALQRWLDSNPAPQFRRVDAAILESAFLMGEAKGLWLRGAHPRRSTKPDSKSVGGQRLQDTLNPLSDATYVLGSARVGLADDPSRSALKGAVGATPRRALFWNTQTPDFPTFRKAMSEALSMVEVVMSDTTAKKQIDCDYVASRPFPELAEAGGSLADVAGAFDLSFVPPEEQLIGSDPDAIDAAVLLEHCLLEVVDPGAKGAFALRVGVDGSIAGKLSVKPESIRGSFRFRFGVLETTDSSTTARIRDALERLQNSIMVRYSSGHAVGEHGVVKLEVRDARFPRWQFLDFTGFDVSKEKPATNEWQAIHNAIGHNGDTSLFSWVARTCTNGWLTCDDGPGEVADFVHLDRNGKIQLIHCKGADNSSDTRRVAVGAYELVVSQAQKNLRYVDANVLADHLAKAPVADPACWIDGQRCLDRSEMIAQLKIRSTNGVSEVVVLQPHLRKVRYEELRTYSQLTTDDHYRLRLLETLLNSARSATVGVCDEFHVWSSI
jgi:hypothetical protein